MIFSFSLIALFVGVSIYYYFRAENLHRQVVLLKKDVNKMKKESKNLVDAFALVAKKNEDFSKFRFKEYHERYRDQEMVDLLFPLFNNYATIFRESIRGNGNTQKIAKKCCESYKKGSYQALTLFIAKQDVHIKRAWSNNNINGFMSFIEAMIFELEKKYPVKSDSHANHKATAEVA